ncbi:MAG TPA: hypothetical protein VIW02_03275, partial [Gammaproteobacteria bacterium]
MNRSQGPNPLHHASRQAARARRPMMPGRIPVERQQIINEIAARARRLAGSRTPLDAEAFARVYFHAADDLVGAALAHLAIAGTRRPGEAIVKVFNPVAQRDGFACAHTVVAVVTDDMPFLVDSLSIVFLQAGLKVHFLAHPVLTVARNGKHRLQKLFQGDAPESARAESWQLLEVDRLAGAAQLSALREKLLDALDDVRSATSDWLPMRRQAREIAARLESDPPPSPRAEVLET